MSRFPILRTGCAALVLLAIAAAAPAQSPAGPVISARPGQRVTKALPAPVSGAIHLSLEQAIDLVLANNQDLNVAVNSAEATQYLLLASEGIFDPVLGGFVNRTHDEQPASSQLVGAAVGVNDAYNFGADVTQLAPWGGVFSLGTAGGWFKTNSTFYEINPSYNAGLRVTFTEPLLRNFGFTPTKWQIWISRNNQDASYQRFVQIIQGGVNSIEQAYWDLVYAYQNLEVAKETLRIAQDLNRITKIRDRRRLARADRHHADRSRHRAGGAADHHGGRADREHAGRLEAVDELRSVAVPDADRPDRRSPGRAREGRRRGGDSHGALPAAGDPAAGLCARQRTGSSTTTGRTRPCRA